MKKFVHRLVCVFVFQVVSLHFAQEHNGGSHHPYSIHLLDNSRLELLDLKKGVWVQNVPALNPSKPTGEEREQEESTCTHLHKRQDVIQLKPLFQSYPSLAQKLHLHRKQQKRYTHTSKSFHAHTHTHKHRDGNTHSNLHTQNVLTRIVFFICLNLSSLG